MTKALFPQLLILLLAVSAFGAEPAAYLKSAPIPFYPALARQARITGKVTLNFVVTEHGDTSEIKAVVETAAVNAKELLRQAAVENLQNWKFAWPHPCDCHSRRKVIFSYQLSSEMESPGRPTVTVRWFGKTEVIRVEIEGDSPQVETSTGR
jgi:TonB family protein